MVAEPNLIPALSRVREIATKRLFGLYDHVVPLSLTDRVTIVHGANGVGKTILLKLVHALFSQDFVFLMSVPYEELVVTLGDGTKLRVQQVDGRYKADEARHTTSVSSLRISALRAGGIPPIECEVNTDHFSFDKWAQQFAASSGFFHALSGDRYFDSRTETMYSPSELWRAFASDSPDRMRTPLTVELPSELLAIISQVKTYLVEAQRLVRLLPKSPKGRRSDIPTLTPTVLADSQEIAARLRDAFTEYGRASQKLDQTFPQRLFDLPQTMTREEIKSVLEEIEDDQAKLSRLGVLDVPPTYPFAPSILDRHDTAKLDAMELFVRDSKEKLKPLVEFASRVEPLLTNINGKFKNKTIRLDREKGLMARASDGSEIRPDQLSSGEQHEIVLLFNLLFRISKNTLVLIDEPELSLHIDWQRQFLPELLSIAASAQIDALVATHSPYIAGERDDLMIDLDSRPD